MRRFRGRGNARVSGRGNIPRLVIKKNTSESAQNTILELAKNYFNFTLSNEADNYLNTKKKSIQSLTY